MRCQAPGQLFYPRNQPFISSKFSFTEKLPARPVRTMTLKLFPRKHRFYREFGSLGRQARSAQPGLNLSTGYPPIYTQGEFGSLSQLPLIMVNALED